MSKEPDEYSLLASIYDPATAWALDPLRREIAGVALAAGADRALDVCCGTGRQCLLLARAGIVSTGLDLSPAMLARAAHKANHPTLVLGDAGRLPFTDGAFPFTSIALALHEKPPRARPDILAEMLRVTALGGLVALVDYLSPRTPSQAFMAVGIKAIERMAGREHHAYYSDFMESGGLEGFLRSHRLIPYEIRRSFLGLIGVALVRRPG